MLHVFIASHFIAAAPQFMQWVQYGDIGCGACGQYRELQAAHSRQRQPKTVHARPMYVNQAPHNPPGAACSTPIHMWHSGSAFLM